MSFSVVLPISETDILLIRRSLPSWLALGSDDVVLSLDKPASPSLKREIRRVVTASSRAECVRTVETERTADWAFHQAHVRRAGFQQANHEAILTGDIDLIVMAGAAKMAKVVGKNGVGLASSLRVPAPSSMIQALRACSYLLKQKLIPPRFSGLYAMWRPYWRETEDQGIKNLRSPIVASYSAAGPGIVGEDTYLFICMRRRYKCVAFNKVYAIGLTRNVEDLPREQFSWGRYLAALGINPAMALLAAISFAYPYLLQGYIYQRGASHGFKDPFAPGFSL